jgi:hypothetical protein
MVKAVKSSMAKQQFAQLDSALTRSKTHEFAMSGNKKLTRALMDQANLIRGHCAEGAWNGSALEKHLCQCCPFSPAVINPN